ncbi:uncharacterized protein LOC111307532 isoform X2 [Durio zibethinus]|uniref:Uncharacterized protein LOC111307532 isoform X2 n=1 Tax=Durio zibethinus TaxID=66656 RepID=A0A6P6A8M6_DURZI|nr:uncharacterized protein LOC111307532 isoform X2 [Durio zibethinus]
MGAARAMKRIPRIKFPQRHPKPSGSELQPQSATRTGDGDLTFFSSSKAPSTVGGKASLQPKRTPLSNEEIEAILVCTSSYSEYNFMGDTLGKIKVIPDHLQVSTPSGDSPQNRSPPDSQPRIDNSSRSYSSLWSQRKLSSAAVMLNLFSLRGLPWNYGADGQEKVQLTAAELESLRSELADIEEREAHLKARLEHIDEILRSACLSGYLYIRTRWTALPGEPAPIDDTDVDDWLPRFVVLHGQCIFFYLLSTGSLPSFTREEEGTQYCFYILTRQGLRYECSHVSKIQVNTWLSALQTNCKVGSDVKAPNGSSEK